MCYSIYIILYYIHLNKSASIRHKQVRQVDEAGRQGRQARLTNLPALIEQHILDTYAGKQ
jgi:hypothetical protein